VDDQDAREPTLKEVFYYDKLIRIMKDHAMGEGRAKTKKDLWGTVIMMWDKTIEDFKPPTMAWYNTHHPRFHEYCAIKGLAILYCGDGIFIAETPEEVKRWEKTFNEPYLRGVERSNNKLQETIEDKGFSRDGWRLFIRRLLMKPVEETESEEE